MNGPRSSSGSTLGRFRRLIEHYTPDGALGRLILGLLVGSAGFTALMYGLFAYTSGLVALLLKATATGLGAAGVCVAVLTLWPIYLSLIGNVESAAAYPDGATDPSPAPSDDEDAYAALKRQYATGEISEEEFQRRVDTLLEHDQRRGDGRSRAPRDADAVRESTNGRREGADAVRETDRA